MRCWMVYLDASKISKFESRTMVKKIRSYMGEHETFLVEYIVWCAQGICRTFVLAVAHVNIKNIINETAMINKILNNVERYTVTWTTSL